MKLTLMTRSRGIDTFQICADAADTGVAQIQASFSGASDELIEPLLHLGFCYGAIVLLIDITNGDPAYLVVQSPAGDSPADLEWARHALNRFEAGWSIDSVGRLRSPAASHLTSAQVRGALVNSRSALAIA